VKNDHQQAILSFIRSLGKARPDSSQSWLNLYAGNSKAARLRKHNLQCYLEQMANRQPRLLMLGEAPGYKGCRLTGVPFSSECLIHEHSFFRNGGYLLLHNPEKLQSEQSARIVWEALDDFDLLPLIWNIFPFHPHVPGNNKSNRTPTKKELELGRPYLEQLLDIFPITHILAVGKKAAMMLGKGNIPHTCLRHPAHGGKTQFREGLAAFLTKNQQ